jgi:hypothetical protein
MVNLHRRTWFMFLVRLTSGGSGDNLACATAASTVARCAFSIFLISLEGHGEKSTRSGSEHELRCT